jgi:hypothetical protein
MWLLRDEISHGVYPELSRMLEMTGGALLLVFDSGIYEIASSNFVKRVVPPSMVRVTH